MTADSVPRKAVPHHAILRISVTGGFMAGAQLTLADGLNCLIGGRGTGKTTALEFLRFGLGLMPDPKIDGARHRAIEALVKANLGGGRVSVEVQTKTGMRYIANRAVNEAVQVLNELDVPVPISLDRDQVFSADVFSQNEIEGIALNPAAQLELLDRFREGDSGRIQRDLAHLRRELDQSTIDLLKVDSEIEDLAGKAAEVPALEERLRGLVDTAGPDATRINEAHTARAARVAEAQFPSLLLSSMKRAVRDIGAAEATFQAALAGQTLKASDDVAKGTMALLEKEGAAFSALLASMIDQLGATLMRAENRVEQLRQTLAVQHAAQEAEYRRFLTEIEEEGGRAAERVALQTALAEAQAAGREKEARETQRSGTLRVRRELLQRVSELRDERFRIRQQVAERLNREIPGLRVSVTQSAELTEYRDQLAEMLKGCGVRQNVVAEQLSEILLPSELARLVHSRDYEGLARSASYDTDRARRILDSLIASGAAYALETVDLNDRPSIQLRDGEVYKESTHLSTGQRCTTILPILLVQSERPLLIDQPEDNLDNAFVFETIVKALRAVKGSRQVVFVTHNPNIPVLGEADRVFVFASDGEHATVRRVGTVDECKDDIECILEGGREAFLQRKARYGH